MHLLIWQDNNRWSFSLVVLGVLTDHASVLSCGSCDSSGVWVGASMACDGIPVLEANEDVFDITATAPGW